MENCFRKETRPRMNDEWIGKTIEKKNQIQNIEKTVKIKVKLPHLNRKQRARKQTFVQIKHRAFIILNKN